jgi:hypothetical protein
VRNNPEEERNQVNRNGSLRYDFLYNDCLKHFSLLEEFSELLA